MIEIPRKVFKHDPVFKKLHELLTRNHVPGKHTQKVLIDNKHIKDFCEEATHFAVLPAANPGGTEIYLHYDVFSWFKPPDGVRVSIRKIGIYEDQAEYEFARLKGLHSTKDSDIPNIN